MMFIPLRYQLIDHLNIDQEFLFHILSLTLNNKMIYMFSSNNSRVVAELTVSIPCH